MIRLIDSTIIFLGEGTTETPKKSRSEQKTDPEDDDNEGWLEETDVGEEMSDAVVNLVHQVSDIQNKITTVTKVLEKMETKQEQMLLLLTKLESTQQTTAVLEKVDEMNKNQLAFHANINSLSSELTKALHQVSKGIIHQVEEILTAEKKLTEEKLIIKPPIVRAEVPLKFGYELENYGLDEAVIDFIVFLMSFV